MQVSFDNYYISLNIFISTYCNIKFSALESCFSRIEQNCQNNRKITVRVHFHIICTVKHEDYVYYIDLVTFERHITITDEEVTITAMTKEEFRL